MEKLFIGLLLVLGFIGLWDGFTTFYGSYNIIGETGTSLIFSIFFSVVITSFLFATSFIWHRKLNDEFLGYLLRAFWLVAFGFDVFTSFIGNKDIILKEFASLSQMAVLVGMTILVSGSPIVFSYLISYGMEND